MLEETETKALIDFVKETHKVELHEVITTGGSTEMIAAIPRGVELKSIKPLLDEYLDAPERIRGCAHLTDLDSFIAHANRQKREGQSALFMNNKRTDTPALIAVYDFHSDKLEPDWCQHKAVYAFPVSEEWREWQKADGTWHSQADFAAWLEDRIVDVIDPSAVPDKAGMFASKVGVDSLAGPSRLLQLSRGLTVRESSRVTNVVNLQTGETALQFETTHADETGAPLKVPGAFMIAIPVFENGALYPIPVRLRYRKQGGSLSWSFSLFRPSRVVDDAIREACKKAEAATGLPLFYGTHES